MKELHFEIGRVLVELDLKPDGFRYTDQEVQEMNQQIANSMARCLGVRQVPVHFVLTEHGMPRLKDNAPIH